MDRRILLKIMKDILREEDVNYIKGSEWIKLSSLIQKEKLSVVIGEAVYKYCPYEYQIYLDEVIMQARNNSLLYLKELFRLDRLFRNNKLSYILMKGIPLSQQIYADCFARMSSDIDILIDEEKMKEAYGLLKELGYRQHVYFDENGTLVTIDKDSSIYGDLDHEIKCIKKLNIKPFAGIEIQKATTAIPIQYIDDFKSNTVDINVNGLSVKTTNTLYSFLHLIANAYENSETIMGALRNCGIKDYFDIMAFLKKYNKKLDWEQICDLSEKYEIKHVFHAVLLNFCDLFGYDLIDDKIIKKFENWSYLTSCTSNGYTVDWVTPFSERIFNEQIRQKEAYDYLRSVIPQQDCCREFQNSDNLSLIFKENTLEIRFRWIYENDERLIISLLNNVPSETLFSDVYIKKQGEEIEAFYCRKSNIKGIPNDLIKLDMKEDVGVYTIRLSVANLVISNCLYFKVLRQRRVIGDYFIRIYLDKKYDCINNTFKLHTLLE